MSVESVAASEGIGVDLSSGDARYFVDVEKVFPAECFLVGVNAADRHVEAAILLVDVSKYRTSFTCGRDGAEAVDFVDVVAIGEETIGKGRHIVAHKEFLQCAVVAEGTIDVAIRIERVYRC